MLKPLYAIIIYLHTTRRGWFRTTCSYSQTHPLFFHVYNILHWPWVMTQADANADTKVSGLQSICCERSRCEGRKDAKDVLNSWKWYFRCMCVCVRVCVFMFQFSLTLNPSKQEKERRQDIPINYLKIFPLYISIMFQFHLFPIIYPLPPIMIIPSLCVPMAFILFSEVAWLFETVFWSQNQLFLTWKLKLHTWLIGGLEPF